MGILHRILTGLGGQDAKIRQESLRVLSEVQKHVAEWSEAFQKLSDRLDELQSEHRKLRGRFYQARGELEAAAAAPKTREEMKAEVFSRIGYIPGKPTPHQG